MAAIFLPFASSSTSLSSQRIFCSSGSAISWTRTWQTSRAPRQRTADEPELLPDDAGEIDAATLLGGADGVVAAVVFTGRCRRCWRVSVKPSTTQLEALGRVDRLRRAAVEVDGAGGGGGEETTAATTAELRTAQGRSSEGRQPSIVSPHRSRLAAEPAAADGDTS